MRASSSPSMIAFLLVCSKLKEVRGMQHAWINYQQNHIVAKVPEKGQICADSKNLCSELQTYRRSVMSHVALTQKCQQ